MKTLRVTLADIEGAAHASTAAATSVTVSVAYSGQVVLTSGTVIPTAVKSRNLGSSGVVDFSVYASDDPVVRSEYRGFAVVVTATVRGPVGSPTTTLVRTVKPLESMGSVVQLGSLPPAEGLPAQWVTVDEVLSDFTERIDGLEGEVSGTANDGTSTIPFGPGESVTNGAITALAFNGASEALRRTEDTGWQDVDWLSTLNGLTISAQRARRAGSLVHYRLTATIGATGLNVGYAAGAVTAGWRPPASFATGLNSYTSGAYLGALCMNAAGTILIQATATGTVNLNCTWGAA